MALSTRPEAFGFEAGSTPHNINTREIVKTSRVVSRMSSMPVQRSKAIVGENAFAHSSGIHQHGILAKRETYEVIDPAVVGWGETELPLTKHSGRAAVKSRLEKLGFNLSEAEIASVFERFKKVGDSKKFVYDDDLASLVDDSLHLEDGEPAICGRCICHAHRYGDAGEGWQDHHRLRNWQRPGERLFQGYRPYHQEQGLAGGLQRARYVCRPGCLG